LMDRVVLPTPPFWLEMAMLITRKVNSSCGRLSKHQASESLFFKGSKFPRIGGEGGTF
jgi:hypothetical protein